MTAAASKSSKIQLDPIKQALDAAAIALPVLFDMCTAANLRAGAMAADEILGSVQFAQKELAHLIEQRAHETAACICGGEGRPLRADCPRHARYVIEGSTRVAALQDRAYCEGAQQALSIAHQSLAAADKWVNEGCGGRRQQAQAVLMTAVEPGASHGPA